MIEGGSLRILACFKDCDSYSFTDLCTKAQYPIDLGGYYIRQLVAKDYLSKTERGIYTLTHNGKRELANNHAAFKRSNRSRLTVLIIVRSGESYTLLRRNVQPFIGRVEWPAGAVMAGETLDAAIMRVSSDRVGLTESTPRLHGFFRRIDLYNDEVFDDKLFAVCTVTQGYRKMPTIASVTGETFSYEAAALADLPGASRALTDILSFSQSSDTYHEQTYVLLETDLFSSPQSITRM